MVEVVHLIIYDTSAPWMFYHSTLHDMSGVIGLARRAWNFSMPALFGKTSKNNTGCWTILCLSVSIVYIPIYLYLGLRSWVDCACDFTKSPANGSSICNILNIYRYIDMYVCIPQNVWWLPRILTLWVPWCHMFEPYLCTGVIFVYFMVSTGRNGRLDQHAKNHWSRMVPPITGPLNAVHCYNQNKLWMDSLIVLYLFGVCVFLSYLYNSIIFYINVIYIYMC